MSLIKSIKGITPEIGSASWIAENATIVGDVKSGKSCSFWYNSIVRGDVNAIRIGNHVNIQDGAVIHCTYEKTTVSIGNNVSIGHNAIIHGCSIADNVLIGMGAIIMDNCKIGSNVIIAAGAVVLENTTVEANTVYAGVPAKKVKSLAASSKASEIKRIAENYKLYASWQ